MTELWDIEIAFYTNKRGIAPDKARTFTILRWMWLGDLRPLAAAIWEGQELDQAVLNLLAKMISDNRLQVVHKRGRPRKPELAARDLVAALAYQHHKDTSSDEAFEAIAKAIGTSDRTVRQAYTAYRKRNK